MITNEILQKDVQDAIKWQPLLHAAEVGVIVKDGVVTLTGIVDSYTKKLEAEDAAKNVAGVKAVVEKIGLFDEKYFLWFEEVDFCQRAKNCGFDTIFVSDLSLLPQKGESFAKLPALKKQAIFGASLIHYFVKHKPIIQTIGLLAISPISFMLAALVNLAELFKPIKRNKNL